MGYLQPDEWQNIEVTRRGAITLLRLHTHDGPLVWTARAHQELADLWVWLSGDEATRVAVLMGTGPNFCVEIISPSLEKEWHDIWVEGRRMISGMVDLNVPLISIVNGPVSIHTELAVLADIVLAAPEASFADRAHMTRGVVPGDGVQVVWRELLGPTRSSYFLLTGASIESEEALRLGIVHEVHEREALLDRALEIAAPLAELSRETLAYASATLRMQDRRLYGEAVAQGLAYAGLARQFYPNPSPSSIVAEPAARED
ncbi:enoyl-CoA hydratase/isomerase family protein [Agrococcus baldri]|uniref:Crotonase n=1 Tax=Agrococcus baldri TaxID=153730 RepID=A0AA87UQX8_9MICO|nr:enoyl-CoA hydratase/isomerase family protein [Agrococcus baldri]GEK79153.1 crotonase [Agrococcus baldri]